MQRDVLFLLRRREHRRQHGVLDLRARQLDDLGEDFDRRFEPAQRVCSEQFAEDPAPDRAAVPGVGPAKLEKYGAQFLKMFK